MFHKDAMMDRLLDACPSLAPALQALREEWKDEPNGPPLYIVLEDFARHICAMLARGESESLDPFFAAVERLLMEGDLEVREAASVGLLENLQNANLHSGTDPAQFREFLGPETARCWSELDRFWSGDAENA